MIRTLALSAVAAGAALGLYMRALAAEPSHPAIDGPFTVDANANHWNVTPAFYAACPALTPYLDAARPLLRVWEGDNPASPVLTVPLVFPDDATAQTLLRGCGAN